MHSKLTQKRQHPFFSIIIPTYNRAELIGRTIKSVLNQSNSDWEIIVVDDGGTDNTEEVVNEFNDQRLRYFWKQNEERGVARNFGASFSTGKYLNFFDSDDIMYNNHLEKAYEFVNTKNNPEVFHSAFDIIDENHIIIESIAVLPDPLNDALIYGNKLSCNGVFVRSDVFMDNKFCEDRALAASEDYELWLRLGSKFMIRSCDIITSGIVQHEGRSVINIDQDKFINRIQLLIHCISITHNDGYYSNSIREIKSNIYLYASLHLAMAGFRADSLRYLLKGYLLKPKNIFIRKTLGIIKNLI